MAKKMTRAALFFMIVTVILTAFYKKATYGPALSLAITFGTGRQAGNGGLRSAEGKAVEAQNAHL